MGSEYTKMSVFNITVALEGQVLLKSRKFLGVAHRRISIGERGMRGRHIIYLLTYLLTYFMVLSPS